MWKDALWLKLPKAEIEKKQIYHGDMTGRFAYFRCVLELPDNAVLTIHITANSRYRLWVNGESVLSGPCKGDLHRQYYETVDLTDWLRPGKNAFCVQVLYCDPDTADIQTDERASIYGVIGQRCGHRLAIEGEVLGPDGSGIASLTTGEADWRVWLDNSFYLKSDETTQFLGAVIENIDFERSPAHWKKPDFDASGWLAAEKADPVIPSGVLYACGVQPRFRICEREIPLLYETEASFVLIFRQPNGAPSGFPESGAITVPSEETLTLILDAGAVMNGYPRYVLQGRGGQVEFTYFEKFGGAGSNLRRDDDANGEAAGLTDSIYLSDGETAYEPFWFRAFRFVRVTIRAHSEPVIFSAVTFRKTGYPLPVDSFIRSSAHWVERLWNICVRTLENCMMETYMDCPYYEQLQFAMDTRLEALYTYAVSSDYALVRKALIDFHYGMLPEGLTPGKYPSVYLQVLSTFSLHYVIMLWEYGRQTGDRETVRLCRGDVDRILDYYDGKIGEDGLVGRLDYWEFVDWHPDWAKTGGTPAALLHGPSTIINLMYAYALSCGASIMEATGRAGLSDEYIQRRDAILHTVQCLCWDDKKGMYREGPNFFQFSRHAQAWAVLNGLQKETDARALLERAIADGSCLRCSFSTAYEWFRALERVGLFDQIRRELEPWIGLLELNCTTCPETPADARSDCHAWSALPLYELIRTVAGIHPSCRRDGVIRIQPHLLDLSDLEGAAATPAGPLRFRYRRTAAGTWRYELQIPEGATGIFVFSDGKENELTAGVHSFEELPQQM